MNDQTIPADKVRELADKYDQDSSGNPERLLVQAIADLRALLPTQQPTTGLLGRWAKHPEHGDVLCVWDKEKDGWVGIRNRVGNDGMGVGLHQVPLDSLTFPHQATKPEEVPAGEAWLVDLSDGSHSGKNVVAFKAGVGYWRTVPSVTLPGHWLDSEVTLVCPLVPERPVSDLQAKYDELEDKYREAQERIKTLEQTAWRIEYDPKNLREGEYVIDIDGDTGTVHKAAMGGSLWCKGGASSNYVHAPWIVFPNEYAATPEAVAEATEARDKEVGE